jgi:glyoxylase-like metal-dependent hydrolase (beta-lactamase superfamily II)
MANPMTAVSVGSDVWVATSRRYQSLSTVIRGDDGSALVIDPNWDADELASVPAELELLGLSCGAGLATHMHYDHVLWHPDLGTPPRYASRWTVWAHGHRREALLAPLVGDLPDDVIEVAGRLVEIPGGRDPHDVPESNHRGEPSVLPAPYELPWGGREIVLHEHDAHAPAHLAVEVVDRRTLVAGDMCSDIELPMLEADTPDLVGYLQGLDRVAEIAARCDLLVPGHGTPSNNPLERVDADRRYLDDLLTRGDSDDPRIGMPDMAEVHEGLKRRAEATR